MATGSKAKDIRNLRLKGHDVITALADTVDHTLERFVQADRRRYWAESHNDKLRLEVEHLGEGMRALRDVNAELGRDLGIAQTNLDKLLNVNTPSPESLERLRKELVRCGEVAAEEREALREQTEGAQDALHVEVEKRQELQVLLDAEREHSRCQRIDLSDVEAALGECRHRAAKGDDRVYELEDALGRCREELGETESLLRREEARRDKKSEKRLQELEAELEMVNVEVAKLEDKNANQRKWLGESWVAKDLLCRAVRRKGDNPTLMAMEQDHLEKGEGRGK